MDEAARTLARDMLLSIQTTYELRCQAEDMHSSLRRTRASLIAAQRRLRKLEERLDDITRNVIEFGRSSRSKSAAASDSNNPQLYIL